MDLIGIWELARFLIQETPALIMSVEGVGKNNFMEEIEIGMHVKCSDLLTALIR